MTLSDDDHFEASFPGDQVTYYTSFTKIQGAVYPLSALKPVQGGLIYSPPTFTTLRFSPISRAAFHGSTEALEILSCCLLSEQQQPEVDYALFLTIYMGKKEMTPILLNLNANPGRDLSSNGMHAAARRGLKHLLSEFVHGDHHASANVRDEFGATPILYAMQLDKPEDSDTIECLLDLGATLEITFGPQRLTYADIARMMGKDHLVKRLTSTVNT